MNETLKTNMEKALKEAEKLSDDLVEMENELLTFQQKRDEIEVPVKIEITMELDEKGKPKYSNDFKREAELKERLKGNSVYTSTIKNIVDCMKDIDKLKRQIKYKEMEFSMWKALCYAGKD